MLSFIFLFVIGTLFGSFFNVCIYRLPRNESIVFPSSHCPQCGHKLGVGDLIPIISYFILRKRCRYCKAPVSFRYPVVELLSGVSFAWISVVVSPPYFLPDFIFSVAFVSLMIMMFFIDLEQQVIPDALSISGISLGLIYNLFKWASLPRTENLNPFFSALLGLFMGYTLIYFIGFIGKILFKKQAMGEGDLFLAALLGACLGWSGVLLSIFIAYLLAGVVACCLLATGKVKMGQYVPFGPALAVAGIITLFFGERIIGWYLGLFL